MENGSGEGIDEERELDLLRRRAYAPDSGLLGDATALARLIELEDRRRQERFADAAPPEEPHPSGEAGAASKAPVAGADAPSVAIGGGAGPRRAPGWHVGLIAATAIVAVLLGGAAWSDLRAQVAAERRVEDAASAADAMARRDAAARAEYRIYMDGLRDDLLALPGTERIAERIIREQLTPYGILYGRTVGAGPTLDHRRCMIIADLPASSVTCIPVADADADPVSVTLPAWYSDADSDLFTGLGELVTYTLMPGGSVVAVPADLATATGSLPTLPAPTATAVPPPGWQ